MTSAVFRSWYISSDEYVLVAEVIRFLHLDFHQHFFDMPGTPLISLTAVIWALIYEIGGGLRLLPHAGLEAFTFQYLPQLFELMRGLTLFFYLASIGLVFAIAAKVSNRAGAAVAAFLVMMSTTYAAYSAMVRVESLAVCFALISVLILLEVIQGTLVPAKREIRLVLLSGFFAGLAAACRFHSITATLPLLLLLLFLRKDQLSEYPGVFLTMRNLVLWVAVPLSIATAIGIGSGYFPSTVLGRSLTTLWPGAFKAIYPLTLIVAVGLLAASALVMIPQTKEWAGKYLHPRVFLLAGGAFAGVIAGTPTILWQYEYFLRSIAYYSASYFDPERAAWPLSKNIPWFLHYYLNLVARDPISIVLLACGAILILVRRDRLLLPFLIACALFFVSKPINLLAGPHHILLWVPFFAIVACYGVAKGYDALPREKRYSAPVGYAAVAVFILAFMKVGYAGPPKVRVDSLGFEGRMRNIQIATDWIHQNAEANSVVAISYFCFNSDVFYGWLKSLDVPQPIRAADTRRYLIWWGDRDALKGMKGYALVSPRDVFYIKHTLDLTKPGHGTDPFADAGFKLVKKFGMADMDEVDLFGFDLTESRASN